MCSVSQRCAYPLSSRTTCCTTEYHAYHPEDCRRLPEWVGVGGISPCERLCCVCSYVSTCCLNGREKPPFPLFLVSYTLALASSAIADSTHLRSVMTLVRDGTCKECRKPMSLPPVPFLPPHSPRLGPGSGHTQVCLNSPGMLGSEDFFTSAAPNVTAAQLRMPSPLHPLIRLARLAS